MRIFPQIVIIALLCALSLSSVAFAQKEKQSKAEQELTTLYDNGMKEFAAKDYNGAIGDLKLLISKAAKSEKIAPVYYTLAAAYYNNKNYADAAKYFQEFISKFPNNSRHDEAVMALATAQIAAGKGGDAIKVLKSLENNPATRDKALLAEGTTFKTLGKTDQAIAAFTKLIKPEIKNEIQSNGALILAQIYADKRDAANAVKLLELLQEKIDLVKNVVHLNSLAVTLGDNFLKDGKYRDALTSYRTVRTRDEIIAVQKERIQSMKDQLKKNAEYQRAHIKEAASIVSKNNAIQASVNDAEKQLKDFEKLPNFSDALWLRMARCFYELNEKWESVVVYQQVLQSKKDAKKEVREPALFGLIISLTDLGQTKEALAKADLYLKEFPKGKNANTVSYMRGAVALQNKDYDTAIKYFGETLNDQPKSTYSNRIQFLLANAYFAQGKYVEAGKAYEAYRKRYPKGTFVGDAEYRVVLSKLFAGKYEEALNGLKDFIKKNPKSKYVPDAKYRICVCLFAAKEYDEIIKRCLAWEKEYPNDSTKGQVLSILGDTYSAQDKQEDAIQAYIKSYKAAVSDDVVQYSLFAAVKIMTKLRQWDRVSKILETYVNNHPENQIAVASMYWIGIAKSKNGKVDEAKKLLSDNIKKFIADRSSDSVDQLLTLLAQLCSRPPHHPQTSGKADAKPTPYYPGVNLHHYLDLTQLPDKPLVKARVDYANALLEKTLRKPAEEKKWMQKMVKEAKPKELSPTLLAHGGDFLLANGELKEAKAYYQELYDSFSKNNLISYAYVGFGKIAYQEKNYTDALKWFSEAIDNASATDKIRDATLGKANVMLVENKLDEAEKLFKQVASVREWRGPATAESIYNLGVIEQKKGHLAKAIAFYQRVTIAYQRYLPWVAKSYLASGESWQKLYAQDPAKLYTSYGDKKVTADKVAVRTYQELLRNKDLANFPETAAAKKRLKELNPG